MHPKFPYQAVIFDLDGTLIDSAPSILKSFGSALQRAGIEPLRPLDGSLIGPPLRQTLSNLTGISEAATLDTLTDYFKESYDSEGYRSTLVYDGVAQLLAFLAGEGVPLAIATNKRELPTLKILEFLGWRGYFSRVGAPDSASPPYPNKAALIASVLGDMGVDGAASLYVGDTLGDGEAAQANRMPFLAAGWGYGSWEAPTTLSNWSYSGSVVEFSRLLGMP